MTLSLFYPQMSVPSQSRSYLIIRLKLMLEGNTLQVSLGCISLSVEQVLFILMYHTVYTAKWVTREKNIRKKNF